MTPLNDGQRRSRLSRRLMMTTAGSGTQMGRDGSFIRSA